MKTVMSTFAGSRLYGTDTDKSDTDVVSIFIPAALDIVMQNCSKTLNESTSTNRRRNISTDIDRTFVPLHVFTKSVEDGNMLRGVELLFTQAPIVTTPIWKELVENRERFVSKQCMRSYRWFCGNLVSISNMSDEGYTSSPTLRRTAHHVIRIGIQLAQFFGKGSIDFPLSEHRDFLLGIKSGATTKDEAVKFGKELSAELDDSLTRSVLPAQADRAWIDDFVMRHYREEVVRAL